MNRVARTIGVATAILLCQGAGAPGAIASPPGTDGEVGIALTYEWYQGGDHLFSTDAIDGYATHGYVAEGRRWDLGVARAQTILGNVDVGLPFGSTVTVGAAWVIAWYDGRAPVNAEVDDGRIRGWLQDGTVRLGRPWDLGTFRWTPFLGASFPLADYPVSGHAAPGSGYVEARAGIRIDHLLGDYGGFGPSSFEVSYGTITNVSKRDLSRLRIAARIGHFLSRRMTLAVSGRFSDVRGGLEWVSLGGPSIHGTGGGAGLDNNLTAARAAWAGMGMAWQPTERWGFDVSLHHLVWGENVEDGLIVSAGVRTAFHGRGAGQVAPAE